MGGLGKDGPTWEGQVEPEKKKKTFKWNRLAFYSEQIEPLF